MQTKHHHKKHSSDTAQSSQVIHNFDKSAEQYDEHAFIQKRALNQLLERVSKPLPEPKNQDKSSKSDHSTGPWYQQILELGAGTGLSTQAIRDKWPQAHLTAIDPSEQMCQINKSRYKNATNSNPNPTTKVPQVHCDSAELHPFPSNLDLIVSNAALHWAQDLTLIAQKAKAALSENGLFSASFFGPDTYKELAHAISDTLGQAITLPAQQFRTPQAIKAIVQEHFPTVRIHQDIVQKSYPDLLSLLKTIKYTGTRGQALPQKPHWTPNFLRGIEASYLREYGQVKASHQLIYLYATTT